MAVEASERAQGDGLEAAEVRRGTKSVDQPHRYPYQPALDGVRAIAVIAVVLFHFGVGPVTGGFLGVDVFLVLSGYLITTLLLREQGSSGRISIGAFYGRRARRLLPALLLVLAAVALFGRFAADDLQLVKLRDDALAALFYVANWRFVFSAEGYFEQFASPSPVSHLWSLAIEEQWYLVWPLVVAGLAAFLGPPVGKERRTWLFAAAGLAVSSAALMALLVDDDNVNRVYYGTDTRAQALLVGVVVAVVFHARTFSTTQQRWLDRAGWLGLAGCVALFVLVASTDTWMYRGGFALAALSSAALVAGAAAPGRGWIHRFLSLPPLPELGRISYGVYLWHWPVLVLLDERRTGLDGTTLTMVRVAATVLVAIASYLLVEQPIRHHRWPVDRAVLGTAAAIAACAVLIALVVPVRANPERQLLAAGAGQPATVGGTRLLIVGDSNGLNMALHFPRTGAGRAFEIRSEASIGCGVVERDEPKCVDPTDEWRRSIDQFDPDVTLMVIGVWEAREVAFAGQRFKPQTSDYGAYLLDRLARAFDALRARGAPVAVLTVPCLHPRNRASAPRQEDVDWVNSILATAVRRAGPAVKLVDYGGFICPAGREREEIDGVHMRDDGIHLTEEGAHLVWEWLIPQLPVRTG